MIYWRRELVNDENLKLVIEFILNYFSNYKTFSIIDLNYINTKLLIENFIYLNWIIINKLRTTKNIV